MPVPRWTRGFWADLPPGERRELSPAAALLARWRKDRMAFRREAVFLDDGRPFGEVMEPWQADDFRALDDPQYRHAYRERPRGYSKTFDMAVEAATELVLGPPGQRLYCVGADEDQGKLLSDDVVAIFRRSPVLKPLIRVTRTEVIVKATGSRLKVLNSNAPTLYGLRPDWIGCDEIPEWRGRAVWDALWTASGKRPRCKVRVIGTAGWDRTGLAWEVREIAERESNWHFSARGQCGASWIDPAWLEQQRRTLPAHVFARLHESRWVEGAGAFFTAAEVEPIFASELPANGGQAALGLDLGLSRDRCALARVRRDARAELVVVEGLWTWTPAPSARVDLREVEEEVAALASRDRLPVVLDPWQAVLMGQRFQARGVKVIEYPFTASGRGKLFGVLLDLIRTGRLRSRPHEALRRELLGLEVKETTTGWRVDHRVGRHDDHVVAVALAASQLVGSRPARPPFAFTTLTGVVTVNPDGSDWTPPEPAATSAPDLAEADRLLAEVEAIAARFDAGEITKQAAEAEAARLEAAFNAVLPEDA